MRSCASDVVRQRAFDRPTRPLVSVLFDPVNTVVVAFTVGFVLLLHALVVATAIVVLDVVVVAGYLAVPSRRAAVIDRIRRKRRVNHAVNMRAGDRVQWMELEETVAATRPSLAAAQVREIERLLDLFVDVGLHAARWEGQIERFGRLPAAGDDAPPLLVARGDRRTRAGKAVESLSAQLATISTLVQLTCEDAVAARALTVVDELAVHVDEARRSAQLAIEASDEMVAGSADLQAAAPTP